ncbi:MAG: orotate phosphoribosyltransferase [Nitrosopumilus sp.]|nr:orotate phosphoribosyltransferase [Nitrosopumilus sp.]
MTEADTKISLLNDLVLFLYEKEAIKVGDFILSSGKKSKYYIDLRILQSYPLYFRKSILLLKKYIIHNIGLNNFEYICSIPTSGTIFGSSLAYELFKPHIYVRKNIKNYGTQKTFEGDLILNSRVLFVDDVMTTGKSLISSVELLKDKSIINDILVFIDREQGAEDFKEKYGIKIHKIISMNDIFEVLYQNNRIDEINSHDLKNELRKT